jgi:HK97 family phage prohead protease
MDHAPQLIERSTEITAHTTDDSGRRVYWALAYAEETPDSFNTTLARGAFNGTTVDDFRILMSHQRDADPVAKPVELEYSPDGLMVGFVFAETERAAEVEHLVAGGFYRAVSIGFIAAAEDTYVRSDGVTVYRAAKLRELSIVNVPSSAGALIDLTRAADETTADDTAEAADPWTGTDAHDLAAPTVATASRLALLARLRQLR